MPRFYLHFTRGGGLVEDPEGSDLPDLEAARQEALAAARDLWANAIVDGRDLSEQQFVIANEDGQSVLVLSFVEALPDGLRQRLLPA